MKTIWELLASQVTVRRTAYREGIYFVYRGVARYPSRVAHVSKLPHINVNDNNEILLFLAGREAGWRYFPMRPFDGWYFISATLWRSKRSVLSGKAPGNDAVPKAKNAVLGFGYDVCE